MFFGKICWEEDGTVSLRDRYIVLILVFREDMLGDHDSLFNHLVSIVLILVFREDMLGADHDSLFNHLVSSLNPCFSGRYAGRAILLVILQLFRVLILVFREDMLGERKECVSGKKIDVLILVFREDMLGGVQPRATHRCIAVLILVFREDMLGAVLYCR